MPRRLFKHGSPSISRHVVSANAQSSKDQGQVLWRLHWTRGRFSAPAANVYLRRHVEVPVDVPRIVLVLRCPRRQILRPWLPMPDRCFKASLIDRVTLLCVDSGADRAVGKDCNRDSRGANGGTRHAQWILHRALETRSSHSKTPILSHHCQGCIRTKIIWLLDGCQSSQNCLTSIGVVTRGRLANLQWNSACPYRQKGATGTRRLASGCLHPPRKTDPGNQEDQVKSLRPADERARMPTWASSAKKSGGYQ